jgi:urease accessory protein
VRAPDRVTLTRAAYHLGNRHTPVEVGSDELKLEADPVLEGMLKRLGAQVERVELPFQPEAGAYSGHSGGGHRHGHDETFAEDYALAQRVFDEHHGPAHDHGHAHGHSHHHDQGGDHVHDAECGHDHGHCDGHAHDHSHEHR